MPISSEPIPDRESNEIDPNTGHRKKFHVLAECRGFVSGRKLIVINKRYWHELSYTRREILMIHELAHCVLQHREHVEDEIDIMNPELLNEPTYLAYRENLLDKLFKRAPNKYKRNNHESR